MDYAETGFVNVAEACLDIWFAHMHGILNPSPLYCMQRLYACCWQLREMYSWRRCILRSTLLACKLEEGLIKSI